MIGLIMVDLQSQYMIMGVLELLHRCSKDGQQLMNY